MNLFVYFLVGSVFYFVVASDHNLRESANKVSYRLPNNTKPESYDIELITNIDKNEFIFLGLVTINLIVLESSSEIKLHARKLAIKSVKLTTKNGHSIDLKPFTYDTTTEFLTIPAEVVLEQNSKYILTIEYVGKLREEHYGFYRSSYVNSQGETKQVIFLNLWSYFFYLKMSKEKSR